MPRRLSFGRLTIFQQPLLFIALFFIGGLTFAGKYRLGAGCWVACGICSWLLISIGLWIKGIDRLTVAFCLICSFVIGGALYAVNEADVAENRVRRLFEYGVLRADEPVEVWGRIDAVPELAPDRIYLSIAVERVATLGRKADATGNVQFVVPFNDEESREEYDSLSLDYGVRVRLLGNLSDKRAYRNPGAPDFDEMLEHRGFDASGTIKSPLLIERLGEGGRNRFLSILYRLRAYGLRSILHRFTQPTSGILAAALLGNRYFLSHDTAESFRAGGTFHLLVISGLHVAMMAVIILRVSGLFCKSRLTQHTITIFFMWCYALMVGAQPSITRSVVMLMIALIGRSIFRAAAGANILAASSIALLARQPRDLFNPAFQLSFLTVVIIVAVTAPLYSRLKAIGNWRPSTLTPYPPRSPRFVIRVAEFLFWDELGHRRDMKESRVRYRLDKWRAAIWLNRMHLQNPVSWVAGTILTTTCVQMGLLPFMVMRFHRASIISLLTNVVEGALVFILMIAGAVCLIIGVIADGLAVKLARIVDAIGLLTDKLCDPLLTWKHASFRVPDFGANNYLILIAYSAAVIVMIIVISEWNPMRRGDEANGLPKTVARVSAAAAAATILILGWFLVAHPFAHKYDRGRLSTTFLDVGQGDAILICFPRGSLMMLDAGGRAAYRNNQRPDEVENVFIEDRIGIAEAAVMPYLWQRGIKKLDWIAASHGDADHVEGFGDITRSFEIGVALKGEPRRYDAPPDIFDLAVRDAKLRLSTVRSGDSFEIDGVRIDVLSPFAGVSQQSGNNSSLVLKITFGKRSILLTGDIEKETESALIERGVDLRADVLKVAHHGSKTSSTTAFLETVRPQHAVISVASPSPYGHPHPGTIARLRECGAKVWKTSECGAVSVSTDGYDLRVETFIRCE